MPILHQMMSSMEAEVIVAWCTPFPVPNTQQALCTPLSGYKLQWHELDLSWNLDKHLSQETFLAQHRNKGMKCGKLLGQLPKPALFLKLIVHHIPFGTEVPSLLSRFNRGSSWSRDQTHVSCIGGWSPSPVSMKKSCIRIRCVYVWLSPWKPRDHA